MMAGDRPASLDDVRSGYLDSLGRADGVHLSVAFREPLNSMTDEYLDQRLALARSSPTSAPNRP
jgi:hypothetical protein